MSAATGWRVSNRLEEVELRAKRFDTLRRAHSVAIALPDFGMPETLAIARLVKRAEANLEKAVRDFAALALLDEQEREAETNTKVEPVSAPSARTGP